MTAIMTETMLAMEEPGATSAAATSMPPVDVLRRTPVSGGKSSGVYDGLDDGDVHSLRGHAKRIADLLDATNHTMTKAIIEIGAELSAAQTLLAGKGREGRFAPWCKRQGLSKSTAYRAIAAYEAFNKCPTVGHFSAKAVYLLSADACPEAATEDAMRLAEQGDFIDEKRAKDIVARHSPEKPERRRLGCGPGSQQNPTPAGNRKRLPPPSGAELPTKDDSAPCGGAGAAVAEDHAAASDDLGSGDRDSGQKIVESGLAGLGAVVAALESLGISEEYRGALDRIRAALEESAGKAEAENEETEEWTL